MKNFHTYYLLILTIFLSCSDREPLNPMDQNNPFTKGKPTGFRAETNRDTVRLFWDYPDIDDLTGFQIYLSRGDNQLKVIDSTDNTKFTYMKTGLGYDTPYHFAIKTKTKFGESNLSDPLSVVLGPVNIWISDIQSSMIWHLSYDGSHVLKQHMIFNPTAIAYQQDTETLWMANYYDKKIIAMDRDLIQKDEIILSGRPVDIAFDEVNKTIFVLQTDSLIQGYTSNGIGNISIKLNEAISWYSKIAYDPKTSSLWVINYLQNSVVRADFEHGISRITSFYNFNRPYSVESDPIDGGVWIGTDSGLVRIQKDNGVTQYKTGMFIGDISIDPNNGDCYYTAKSLEKNTWETGRIPSSNPEVSIQILGDEFAYLYNIKIVPGSGSPGFFVQQRSTGKLLRFNAKGELIGEMKHFDSFLDFALD